MSAGLSVSGHKTINVCMYVCIDRSKDLNVCTIQYADNGLSFSR